MLKLVARNEKEKKAWQTLAPYVRELHDIIVGDRAVIVWVHVGEKFNKSNVAGMFGYFQDGSVGVWVASAVDSRSTRSTLAHEFIHVDQHLDGRFAAWNSDGNAVKAAFDSDDRSVPWEVEATRLQVPLMETAMANIGER